MPYRLIEDMPDIAMYGWVLNEDQFKAIPYYNKSICEQFTDESIYDYKVIFYKNKKKVSEFLFYESEETEMIIVKSHPSTIYDNVIYIENQSELVDGICILTLKI
jgi:hypothetical protein